MTPSLRVLVLAVLLAALLPYAASAQITLTFDDALAQMTTSGTTTVYDVEAPSAIPALQVLADRSGGGQTWDLSALPWTNAVTVSFAPAAPPVPGSDDITGVSDIVQFTEGDSTGYVFYALSQNALVTLAVTGDIDDGAGGMVVGGVKFSPFNVVFPLPLTSASTWSGTYFLYTIPEIDGFLIENVETAAVEGWGTLVTPSGSAEVLKVRRRTVSTTTLSIPGLPPIVTTSAFAVVEFVATQGSGATIDLDGDGNATGANYSALMSGGTAASTAPPDGRLALTLRGANPVRRGGLLEVGFVLPAPSHSRLEVFDALGRHVSTLAEGLRAAGPHRVSLATAALAPGVYLVRLEAGSLTQSVRLVVVR